MAKERVIVNLKNADDARKVEETVKTGYTETSVETILQWIAVEEDLADSYLRMSKDSRDSRARETYAELHRESRATVDELSSLLKPFEELDRKRVKRIELLRGTPAEPD
jgi:hypothetical protein